MRQSPYQSHMDLCETLQKWLRAEIDPPRDERIRLADGVGRMRDTLASAKAYEDRRWREEKPLRVVTMGTQKI